MPGVSEYQWKGSKVAGNQSHARTRTRRYLFVVGRLGETLNRTSHVLLQSVPPTCQRQYVKMEGPGLLSGPSGKSWSGLFVTIPLNGAQRVETAAQAANSRYRAIDSKARPSRVNVNVSPRSGTDLNETLSTPKISVGPVEPPKSFLALK